MVDQVHIVGFDASALKALATAISNASSTLPERTPFGRRKAGLPGVNNKDPIPATARSMSSLSNEVGRLEDTFEKLGRAIKKVTKDFGGLVSRQAHDTGPRKTPRATKVREQHSDKNTSFIDSRLNDISRNFQLASEQMSESSGLLANKFKRIVAEGGPGAYITNNIFDALEGPFIQVVNDIFKLQRRGVSAYDNLFEFYKTAIWAGMSLDEYIALVEANTVAIARSKSLPAFNKSLEDTTTQLAELAVFGAAARNVTAVMKSSATVLGVPQAQLGNVVTSQIKVFKQLRDVTGMTAAGFQQIVAEFSKMEEAQGLLLGMAPAQRRAAKEDLFKSYTLGHQLGLTAEASQRLGAALLAQRRMTAVDRFTAQGTIRQAGAIVGMGAHETEELARLSFMKNRSVEDNKRFVELGGRMQAGIEAMQNSGSISAQHIADKLSEQFPSGLPEQLRIAGEALLTTQSGPVQTHFDTTTGKFGQYVGLFGTWVEGITKSPLYDIAAVLGGIAVGMVAFKALAAGAAASGIIGGGGISGAIAKGLKGVFGKGTKAAKDKAGSKAPTPARATKPKADGPGSKGYKAAKGKAGAIAPAKAISLGGGIGGYISRTMDSISDGIRTGSIAVVNAGMSSRRYIANIGKSIGGGLDNLGSALWGSSRGVVLGGAAATSSIEIMGRGLLKGLTGPFAIIFSGIEELFTGEMTKALGLGDGIFGRILGVVIAGVNGIFTGVSRLFDGAVNGLLDLLGINFTVNTTRFFDLVTSYIVDGWKMIGAVLMKTLASVIESVVGIFGIKAPFVDQLRARADKIDESIAASAANRAAILATEEGNLRQQGKNLKEKEKNAKAAAAVAAKAATAAAGVPDAINKIAINAVGTGTVLDSLIHSAQSTAHYARVGTPQGVMIAAPVQTARIGVTPPDINKTLAENKKESIVVSNNSSVDNLPGVLSLLQQQIEIAKLQLAIMAGKNDAPPTQSARSSLPSIADLTTAIYG